MSFSEFFRSINSLEIKKITCKVGSFQINLYSEKTYQDLLKEIKKKFDIRESLFKLFNVDVFIINSSELHNTIGSLYEGHKDQSSKSKYDEMEIRGFDIIDLDELKFGWLKLPPTINYAEDYISYWLIKGKKFYLIIDKDSEKFVTYINTFFITIFSVLFNIYWIHASGISFNNKGILIVGPSGSGKTTMCIDFLSNGAKLVSDGVCFLKKRRIVDHFYSIPPHLLVGEKTLSDYFDAINSKISQRRIKSDSYKTILSLKKEVICNAKPKIKMIIVPEYSSQYSLKMLRKRDFFRSYKDDLYKPELINFSKLVKLSFYLKIRIAIFWKLILSKIIIIKVNIDKTNSKGSYFSLRNDINNILNS